ncbi:molybdenum ABC transporter permease subunit [Agarivorans sp. Toyoura001]|uniref:molybdate ABC transporter permease subunit n=1 Tax=Agarivorans sp. Toyoura001 TaxID=2283141 RepID=UPI0010EBDBCE|nr:molybdate ABC transporter permease subunit [Agarivorans sp. Toyoura001]GDY26067.1 molybdenum ABC transporter permease subunit [Agarivorans sp. Toyoura001]
MPDLVVVYLTLKLASVVTLILLIVATPLAWWMSQTQSPYKSIVGAMFALPLVLPPTVLGFYLLLLLGPNGALGVLSEFVGIGALPFTFTGIVIACVVHTLPFVVQPMQNAFEAIGKRPLEVAKTLRASPSRVFWKVAFPLARPGFFAAAILGFCHTIGEFGVVLMIGGNIAGETRVMSIDIYNHVEALEYSQAHWLAGGMLVFSFVALLLIYSLNDFVKRRLTQCA